MGRILAIDYGKKRTGIASTDPLKMIASPLTTVNTPELFKYLTDYCQAEDVERFVVGMPKNLQNEATDSTAMVVKFINKLKQQFPAIAVSEVDERFTSKIAFSAMLDGGMKKKDRKNKGNIDKISAAVILQSYLDQSPSF